MPFTFEQLTVYRRSLDLARRIFVLKKGIKDWAIADQLGRAVLSIPLNIAEGQGRVHQRRRPRSSAGKEASLQHGQRLTL